MRSVGFLLVLATATMCPARAYDLAVGQSQQGSDKAIGLAEAVQSLPEALQTPRRYALVVGAGQYADSRIPPLPAGANDARRLRELLIDPAVGMFAPEDVTVLVDAQVTRMSVVNALDALGRRAGPDDLVLVFFSGHGAVDNRNHSYWVMSDSRIDSLRATALSETEITDLLGDIESRRLVVLIDACYSASTARLGATKSLLNLQEIYPKFAGQGRVMIAASQGSQLSMVITDEQHPGYGHSAFAYHMLEGMRGRADGDQDGVVTVDELWFYVKDRTAATARRQGGNQQPILQGELGSRFLLTIDGEGLLRSSQETQALLKHVKEMFLAGSIDAVTCQEAEQLLGTPNAHLDVLQRARKQIYRDLAQGHLRSEYLQAALAAVGQRAAGLEREINEPMGRGESGPLDRLLGFYLDGRIDKDQWDFCRTLLSEPIEELDEVESLCLEVVLRLIRGELTPEAFTETLREARGGSEQQEVIPVDALGVIFTQPPTGEIEYRGRRYAISENPTLYLRQGDHPLVVTIGEQRLYCQVRVHYVDDIARMILWGGPGGDPLFKDSHIAAALRGSPVRFSFKFESSDGTREVISYSISLHKFW